MWTIKQFELVYDRFQSSGLPVKDFCENECILQSKFYYWKKKLLEQNQHSEQPSDFVPIVFSGSSPQLPAKKKVQQKPIPEHADPVTCDVFEIVYPNGVKLRVPVGSDINQLRSLILLTQ
ncbi:MAG: IS66 family insertion sequence element accessory protein TnpB [Fermentimonas sp.]|nr:IS66 family insertion sequence element accessory protein TnpB [Fermentimonas sp.]